MNETLEAMARALFKSWFVDFDPVRARAADRDPGLPSPSPTSSPPASWTPSWARFRRGGGLFRWMRWSRSCDAACTQREPGLPLCGHAPSAARVHPRTKAHVRCTRRTASDEADIEWSRGRRQCPDTSNPNDLWSGRYDAAGPKAALFRVMPVRCAWRPFASHDAVSKRSGTRLREIAETSRPRGLERAQQT